jgi:hypothetical protein
VAARGELARLEPALADAEELWRRQQKVLDAVSRAAQGAAGSIAAGADAAGGARDTQADLNAHFADAKARLAEYQEQFQRYKDEIQARVQPVVADLSKKLEDLAGWLDKGKNFVHDLRTELEKTDAARDFADALGAGWRAAEKLVGFLGTLFGTSLPNYKDAQDKANAPAEKFAKAVADAARDVKALFEGIEKWLDRLTKLDKWLTDKFGVGLGPEAGNYLGIITNAALDAPEPPPPPAPWAAPRDAHQRGPNAPAPAPAPVVVAPPPIEGLPPDFDLGAYYADLFRAEGGPVERGRPYVVGEGGRPELFVPGADGYVYPMAGGAAGGGGTQISVTVAAGAVTVNGGGAGTQGQARQLADAIAGVVREFAASELRFGNAAPERLPGAI